MIDPAKAAGTFVLLAATAPIIAHPVATGLSIYPAIRPRHDFRSRPVIALVKIAIDYRLFSGVVRCSRLINEALQQRGASITSPASLQVNVLFYIVSF